MGRPIPQAADPAVSIMTSSVVQEGVAIAIDAWEDIFPATFLILSLILQLVLLVTGELRKYTSKVRLVAWLAYVGADVLASFLLGLLSRSSTHAGILGLWSALLIYHLGGPDNFTAYERADSELWLRHLLYLVLQVATAVYVIAVNTRGLFIIPTLLVFMVGVFRYGERNHALKWSSRKRINEEMTPINEYMERMPTIVNNDTSKNETLAADHEQLQYIVAGGKAWHEAIGGRTKTSHHDSTESLVTTSDVLKVVNSKFSGSDSTRVRACQLCVAFASSFAFLRRIVALSRSEQSNERSQTRMRRLWFSNEEYIKRHEWLAYVLIERDFLYNWLYAKPIYVDTYILRLFLRVLCSVALFGALVLVLVSPLYVKHADESIWGARAHKRLKKDATHVVLAAGFCVEVVHLLRVLASKRAVVAMLVAVVQSERCRLVSSRQSAILGSFKELWASFVLGTCKLSLAVNTFFENKLSKRKVTYLPRSIYFYRLLSTKCRWLRDRLHIPQTGWDQMYETVALINGCEFQTQLQCIQAQEAVAIDRILGMIEEMTTYTVWSQYLSRGERTKPIHLLEFLDIFIVYYDSNWETILLIWWIGTLKVLVLEGHQCEQIQDKTSDEESMPPTSSDEFINSPRDDLEVNHASTETSTDNPQDYVKFVDSTAEEEEGIKSSSKCTFEDENIQQRSSSVCELRNRALWLMAYVCRLLTVCPELLPTHLELTKKKVAKELERAHYQITNETNWMEDTRSKVNNLNIPTLKFGERRSQDVIEETIGRMRDEGFDTAENMRDTNSRSTELAVLLVDCMSAEDRWTLIEGSAAHFVACLGNASKTVDHCAKLTQGGELLTFLWILFSHLGGGTT